jgi:hypothetical protein
MAQAIAFRAVGAETPGTAITVDLKQKRDILV